MQHDSGERERAPEVIERFVKQLLVTYKAVNLYPPASDIPRDSAADLLGILRLVLRDTSELRLQVTKDALLYDDIPILPGMRAFELFAREFYNRYLAEVRFHSGATAAELIKFLRVLQEEPEDIHSAGGFEQRLWDQQVDGITVRVISTKIVDSEIPTEEESDDEDDSFPPTREEVDQLLDSTYSIRPRDQRMLVRFAQNPRLVSRYLEDLSATGRGGRPLVNVLAAKLAALAHLVQGELPDDQPALFRSIAEGILGLEGDTRTSLLTERLLPDSRNDEAIAGILRQLELGELCRALAQGLTPDKVSQDGVSRAIRNLAMISLHPKEDVLSAAEIALRESGADEPTVHAVLENASPSQLRVRPAREVTNESVESVLRLVDLAPVALEGTDPEIDRLRAEVADGVTDGDILFSIVTLVTVERRPEMFASLMAMVEDGLGLLLELGEYEAAADAAHALAAIGDDGHLDDAQSSRIRSALAAMASPAHMRDVSAALRRHQPGTPEHESCRRLLATLGGHTVGPFLEVLADEPDMAIRKSLMDLMSSMSTLHIDDLGERVSDPRWYFVRNVVNLLGTTHKVEALPHLHRTLRHADARVRRETIRAVSGIRDRFSEEMLIAALNDDDAQNVGLAARYLATARVRASVQPLAAVARGEGRGNRTVPARVEAIEALGKLGLPEAAPVLQEIARPRGLIRGARSREIRTAAEAALVILRRTPAGGGA